MDFRVVSGIVLLIIGVGFVFVSLQFSYTHHVNSPTKGEGYYPVSIVDGIGKTVVLTSFPSRIVSIAPSATQVLVSLGLGKYLVGIDCYSSQLLQELNQSSLVSGAKVITDIYPLNVTGISLLKPNIVVADAGLEGSDYQKLNDANLSVLYLHGDLDVNFHQIEDDVMMTATAFNRVAQGNQLVSWMNQKVSEFSTSNVNETIAYVLCVCPDFSFYTVGGNTFISNVMTHAGGENVFSNQEGYPLDHLSQLIISNPDVVVFTVMYNLTYTENVIHQMETQYPELQNVTAFKEGNIYFLEQGLPVSIMNEPGPLSVYGIAVFHDIMDSKAPHVITQSWVEENLNVSLPVF